MIARLSQRDRMALAVGGVAVAVTLLFTGVVTPYSEALDRLDSKIASRQRQLKEVQGLQQEYQLLRAQVGRAERQLAQGESFSLFSFVEGLTGRVASKENLVNMRPQPPSVQEGVKEESVEIKLEKIRLDQLVKLLYEVDANQALLRTKSLRIKTRFEDRTLLDATVTIASYGRTP